MNQLLIFLPIALLLLAILLVWALRTRGPAADNKTSPDAREALTSLEQLELPSQAVVERVFATQDWDYISSQTSPRIQRMFLRERRTIALSWLRQMRKQAAHLVDLHLRVVRRNVNLRPATEIGLAFRYVLFLLQSEVLAVLIWLVGPFRSRRMVDYAVGVAQQLGYISGRVLDNMNAARVGGVKASWPDRTATS